MTRRGSGVRVPYGPPAESPAEGGAACKENHPWSGGEVGEGDSVAEVVELADEVVASFVCVGAPGEPFSAEVPVVEVVGEEVPGDHQDRVADGDRGLAFADPPGEAPVLGDEVCRGCATPPPRIG
jgi:hypothetical protein